MPTGWQALGDVLGGGIDRQGAYDEGRLRTAQTEGALLAARERQLKNLTTEAQMREQAKLDDTYAAMGVPNPREMATITRSGLASDFSQATTGMGNVQEYNFRETLADPTAPLGEQFAAGQGVQGKVLSPYEFNGQNVVDVRAPAAPGAAPPIFTTPIGQAQIGADQALTNLRTVQAGDPDYRTASGSGSDAPGGVKAPSGYMVNPNFNSALPASTENPPVIPIPGGPQDPNVGPALGSRERQVIGRIFNAAANTVGDIETIVNMTTAADQGFLGMGLGAGPAVSVLNATAGNLKRTLAADEVIRYNSLLGGFSNQLRTLEAMGLAGTQGMAAQYDSLAFTPQDDISSKMFKLAQVRQSVENSVRTITALNPNMPDDAKRWSQEIIAGIARAVPYTRDDVTAFEAASKTNPQLTLKDTIAQRKFAAPVTAPAGPSTAQSRAAAGAVVAPPDLPLKNAKGWDLMIDAGGNRAYVSPSGEIEEVP